MKPTKKRFIAIQLIPLAGLVYPFGVWVVFWYFFNEWVLSVSVFQVLLYFGIVTGAGMFFVLAYLIRTRVKILRYDLNLRNKNEVYSLLTQGLNDGIWDWDVKRKTVDFSDRWKEMLGYKGEVVPDGENFWFESIHPEDLASVKQAIDLHFQKKRGQFRAEYRLKTKSGAFVWVLDRGHAVWSDKGVPLRMVGLISDQSESKRAGDVLEARTLELEQAKEIMAKDRAHTTALLASIGEGMVAVDERGRIMNMNDAAARLLRVEAKDTLSLAFDYIIPKEEDKKEKEIPAEERFVAKTLATSEKKSGVAYYHRKDGTRFPVFVTSSPIVLAGKLAGAIVVFRDITKELEIDKSKTEFVSLASHQLRTPLSAIRWYSEVLLGEKLGPLNEKQKQYLAEVHGSNIRMIALVNSLLNVSRIELGTFAVDPKEINLAQIAESVLGELTPKIMAKRLLISKDYKNAPTTYLGDENLLRIVLQNLISNAVKYTPEGGSVSVAISNDGKMVRIGVADTGYGIPAEDKDKMFSKLFRADNVREKVTEGTGLGLYIVKSIVEKSGGRIWFESELDKGTTFYIELPFRGMAEIRGTRGLM